MKIHELKRIIDIYGDVKISEAIKSYGRPYTCPKCNGDGVKKVTYNAYPSGLPDSGWVEDIRTRDIGCDLCEGHGYTEKELKPIIKKEIVGYE
jgi:DnaJ-class molecular chaperone